MAEHLAKRLVNLPHMALTPKAIPALSLHHRVGGFEARPLVVVLQELLAVAHEVVVLLRGVPPPRGGCNIDASGRAHNGSGTLSFRKHYNWGLPAPGIQAQKHLYKSRLFLR